MPWDLIEIKIYDSTDNQRYAYRVNKDGRLCDANDVFLCHISAMKGYGYKICEMSQGDNVHLKVKAKGSKDVLLTSLRGKSELKVSDLFDESGELHMRHRAYFMLYLGAEFSYISRGLINIAATLSILAPLLLNANILYCTAFVSGLVSITGVDLALYLKSYVSHNRVLNYDIVVPYSCISTGVLWSTAIYLVSEPIQSPILTIGCAMAYGATIAAIDYKMQDLASRCNF
ncbi:MAG: hypothetical protein ACK5WS_00505 [Alphaproteobacteria bacterium]|jgi:hypothetical protein|nr:hypothetical protein [Candidatus Jidaibacter sp.]